MNKKELINQVSKKTGMTQEKTLEAIHAVLGSIKTSLEEGESVVFQGFGSFVIKERAQRNGVNPSTKQPMTIPTRKVVKFVTSKSLNVK